MSRLPIAIVMISLGAWVAACGDNVHSTAVDARLADAHADASPTVDACAPRAAATFASLISADLVLDATQNVNTMAMTVPLDRSILFSSLRENEPSPANGGVQCTLHDVDVADGLPAGVTCRRTTPGTDSASSTGIITVHISIATFTSGVSVQRGVANTGFTNPSLITLTPVDPAHAFVVLGGMTNGGSGWGSNEFVRARLTDTQTLDVSTNVAGTSVAWQVVSMDGANVQRGTATIASADTSATATITSAPNALVLASYTTDNTSGLAAATIMLRSTLTSPTTLEFQRGLGGSGLDIAWEAVSLPFATRVGTTNLDAGTASTTVAIGGLAGDKGVVLASTQAILGQASGSTNYGGADLDLVGEGVASFTPMIGSVSIERATSLSDASLSWTAVDFAHDECSAL